MRWFRTRSRLGSCLALFALALQLALSFGHVHLDGDAPDSGHPSVLSDAQPATALDPTNHDSPAADDDHCPICALIHLARTLVQAEAPSLPLPGDFEQLRFEAASDFGLAAPNDAPFQARAPPIV